MTVDEERLKELRERAKDNQMCVIEINGTDDFLVCDLDDPIPTAGVLAHGLDEVERWLDPVARWIGINGTMPVFDGASNSEQQHMTI